MGDCVLIPWSYCSDVQMVEDVRAFGMTHQFENAAKETFR